MNSEIKSFIKLNKPNLALITNHGYGGVDIPVGGAPDTGGQNLYVNAYAEALDNLGYKVTIYARGGFPFFESDKIRDGQEFLTPNVRYIYVPGGGDKFIRKEDISIALNEELDWIYRQIAEEAAIAGMLPWQYYQMINTHYWDAGVIGASLVAKWENDICYKIIEFMTVGVVSKKALDRFYHDRHFQSLGEATDFSLGELLLNSAAENTYVFKREKMLEIFKDWFEKSPIAPDVDNYEKLILWDGLLDTVAARSNELRPLVLAKVLGKSIMHLKVNNAVFDKSELKSYKNADGLETYEDLVRIATIDINKHVWTPHSLSVIKERNFKDKSDEINRKLKFRERRSHERMLCNFTPAFGATSYEIAESLITNYGVPAEELVFFPPGVDISLFRQYSDEELEPLYAYLNKETGLSAESIKSATVMFEASRMDSTKRKDVLLKAFARALENMDQNCLLFIGGGPENEEFKSLQEILNSKPALKEKAFLLGFIPDEFLPKLFGFCDIYLTASEMEGFGMSVAQAAMAAKPIVSSDMIPFTNFFISDEAIIAPAGDVEAFASGIQYFVGHAEERKNRGMKAKEKALDMEWKTLAKSFIFDLNKIKFNITIPEK